MTNTTGSTITDIAASPHNGTATGSFTLNQTSLLNDDANPAILMTGGAVTSSAFFSATTGASVTMLVKFPSLVTTNFLTVGSPSTGVGGFFFRYISSSHTWRVTYANSGVNIDLEAGVSWIANETYELTFALNFATGQGFFYQNGRLIGSPTGARIPVAISSKAVVLGDATTNAIVDEVALFADSILTSTNVLDLFKSSRAIDETTTSFYADDAGNVNAHATLLDPAELQWLLSSGLTGPGTFVYVRGGTYAPTAITSYSVVQSGTAGNLLTVTNYSGERAVIDVVSHIGSTGGAVTLSGSYIRLQGLEITNSDTSSRISAQSGSAPTDVGVICEGVYNVGSYNEIINNIIYDIRGNGISDESTPTNTTVYGNLIFNVGWQGPDRGHGHAIYTQNSTPSAKLDKDNIMFNEFGYGVHAFSTAGTVDNFTFEGNTSFQGGYASVAYTGTGGLAGSPTLFLGAQAAASNILYKDNLSYVSSAAGSAFLIGGSTTAVYNTDVTFSGTNVSVGGTGALQLSNWATVIASGLKLYGTLNGGGTVFNTGQRNGLAPTSANWSVNNNTYYNLTPLSGGLRFGYTVGGTGGGSFKTFAQMKAITGFDASSTETIGAMPDAVYIRPNTYRTGAGTITAYNLTGASTISANLSTLGLVDGQSFTVVNAQNPFGSPVFTGTYSASSPSSTITVTSTTLQVPIGFTPYSASMASTMPNFFVGIVVPGDANPSAPDEPTGLTAAWTFSSQGAVANITLAWTNPTSGAAVIWEKSLDGASWSTGGTTAADATGVLVTGLSNSGLNYFRVRASKSGLESANSNPVSQYATKLYCYLPTCSLAVAYPSVTVSGAGTAAADGTYTFASTVNGKPRYERIDGADLWIIEWGGLTWDIYLFGGDVAYSSSDNTAFPWQAVFTESLGSAPAPSVAQS